MRANEQEIEAKFLLSNPTALEERLKELDAELVQPRVHELNLRFDTADGALTKNYRVLRLRRDARVRLTYKGPALQGEDVSVRREIEFKVDDFDAARSFLEALGYVVSIMYEKFRTVYHLDGLEVTLDEMPYGHFSEIEGPDADRIKAMARKVGLNWEARCVESYLAIFKHIIQAGDLSFHNLTFTELEGYRFTAEDLGLQIADVLDD